VELPAVGLESREDWGDAIEKGGVGRRGEGRCGG